MAARVHLTMFPDGLGGCKSWEGEDPPVGSFIYDNDMSTADPINFTQNDVHLIANNAPPNTIVSATGGITMTYVWLDPAVYPGSVGTGLRTGYMCETRFTLGTSARAEIFASLKIGIPLDYFHPDAGDPVGYAWGSEGSYNNKLFLVFSEDYEDGPLLASIELFPHDTESGASKGSIRMFSIPAGIDFNGGMGQMPNMVMLADRGHDLTFYFHYAPATVANNDGVWEVWKQVDDGMPVKVCNIHNGAWYSATFTEFTEGYFMGYHNSAYPAASFADNMVFVIKGFQIADSDMWDLP